MLDSDVRAKLHPEGHAHRELDAKVVGEGLTFDDVLVVPRYSDVQPAEADTTTWLTRGIRLEIPITASAMDTVSEARLCVALAREGGIGFIQHPAGQPVHRRGSALQHSVLQEYLHKAHRDGRVGRAQGMPQLSQAVTVTRSVVLALRPSRARAVSVT